eukprot:scaffold27300_cov65-Isochrysis_galbana.AAC.2
MASAAPGASCPPMGGWLMLPTRCRQSEPRRCCCRVTIGRRNTGGGGQDGVWGRAGCVAASGAEEPGQEGEGTRIPTPYNPAPNAFGISKPLYPVKPVCSSARPCRALRRRPHAARRDAPVRSGPAGATRHAAAGRSGAGAA